MPLIKPAHVFILLSIFLLVWVVTELYENYRMDKVVKDVEEFMDAGERYTTDQGNADREEGRRERYNLCVRIRHLEAVHHGRDVPVCQEPE